MAKSFGQTRQHIEKLGGELKLRHLLAIKTLGKHGNTIYDRELAETLREIEKLSPGLISILPYTESSGIYQRPFFICFKTTLGEHFMKHF